MQVNLFNRLKDSILEVLKSRLFVLIVVFCILSAILIQRVFYLQIVKGEDYLNNYKLKIQKTKPSKELEELYMTSTGGACYKQARLFRTD